MTHPERLDAALRSAEPARSLRAAVLELAREKLTKAEIYELLEKLLLRLRVRADCREADEEAVLDVMDALTGWCHPDARLLPDDEAADSRAKG